LTNAIESLQPNVSAAHARVGRFDFDTTISQIRSGWVGVIAPMLE
jgi:hypothetical protein